MSGEVRRVLAGYTLSSVANGLPWPLLLTLVFARYGDEPHGAWVLGLAAAARMAPYVLLSWAVASLGDHVRRDLLVRLTMSLRVLCLGVTALAVESDHLGVAILAAALAVSVGTPTYPAIAAALPRLAGEHRTRATQLLVTAEVSSWVVGPAIGGLLLAPVTRPYAVLVAVAMALVARLLVVGVAMPAPTERATDAVAGMLRAVVGCRPALVALGLAAVTNVVETTVALTLLPISGSASAYGVAVACLGAGALGAPLLCRLVGATTTRGLVLVAASIAVVALTPLTPVALPFLVLAGAAGVVVETVVTATLQDAVPDRYRAGALGVADTVMVASCLVATLAAPPLAHLVGARPLLLATALATAVPVALAYRSGRAGRSSDMPIARDPVPDFSPALKLDDEKARMIASLHDQAAASFAETGSAPGGELGEGGACIEAIIRKVDDRCADFADAAQELALQVGYATQGLRHIDDAIQTNVTRLEEKLG